MFRFRLAHIRSSVVADTFPKVMRLCYPNAWNPKSLNHNDLFYEFPNGAQIWFAGLDDKERTEKILGTEYATIFLNESSQIPWSSRNKAITRLAQKVKDEVTGEDLKLKAYYDLNPDWKNKWVYRLFYEKRDPTNKTPLRRPDNYRVFRLHPWDNMENLSPEYIEELKDLPERERRRFFEGEYGEPGAGQLWTEECLELCRASRIPGLVRVVVAVDPSGCQGEEDTRSDEVGIVVVALGVDGHGYVLEDLSGHYGPHGWSRVVQSAYERHKADRVVAETNYGGAMVEAVIKARGRGHMAYTDVNASRGKVPRAEPIADLYELGKVHHNGIFTDLEDELQLFTLAGYQGSLSPGRADALIWGLTHLFEGLTKAEEDEFSRRRQTQVNRGQRGASRLDKRR